MATIIERRKECPYILDFFSLDQSKGVAFPFSVSSPYASAPLTSCNSAVMQAGYAGGRKDDDTMVIQENEGMELGHNSRPLSFFLFVFRSYHFLF